MKLGVGYPWASPFTFTDFTDSVLNLEHPPGCEVKFFRGLGWCPARRHISLCEQAINWGADLICIIGADQIYPPNMLIQLIQRFNEGYEVISALIPARGYVAWQLMKPFQPMAWRFKTSTNPKIRQFRGMSFDGDMVETVTREHGGMQRVNFIGSGVLMFPTDDLLALKRPWFYETFDREYVRIANMDCTFVWRLQQEVGAKVWVDTTIKIKHAHVFAIDDTFSERFADWAIEGKGDLKVCNFPKKMHGSQISN